MIKLTKAIEILSEATYGRSFTLDKDWYDSLKLLIEAGKRIKYLQGIALYRADTILPGQQPE